MKEFFEAIRAGDMDKISAMVAAEPALLAARDENGLGAFMVAKYSRREEAARFLLERGVELDLFAASAAGSLERVSEILAAQPDDKASYSNDGWTALHLAAFFGHAEVAEALLAQGAAVNARSTNAMRNTPLHAATAGRHAGVVRTLAAHHADVKARQSGGWTALHSAAQNGDVEIARLLIELGADVGARAENNQSPLDMALTGGHKAMAELLEEHGAG